MSERKIFSDPEDYPPFTKDGPKGPRTLMLSREEDGPQPSWIAARKVIWAAHCPSRLEQVLPPTDWGISGMISNQDTGRNGLNLEMAGKEHSWRRAALRLAIF